MIGLFVGSCRSLLAAKASSSLAVGATKKGGSPGRSGRQFTSGFGSFGLRFNGKQKKTQTFRRLAEGIHALIEALHQCSGMAEYDFIRLGDELQTVYGSSTELAQQIVGAISIIESDDGTGILQELQTLVRGSLASLTACRDEAADKEKIIVTIASDVAGLDRYCSEAERMATYLTVIGFNIRIESAQKKEFDKLFGVIAEEIKRSSGRTGEIVERIRDDAACLCREQTEVSAKIVAALNELGGLADKADILVSQAFGKIEELISLACVELGRAGDHSETLTRQVGEIVMGIQLHDSMNQRVAHIIDALVDVEGMINDGATQQSIGMRDILNLQQAQLQYLVAEVETAHSRSQDALAAIGSCVDQLTGSLTGFEEPCDHRTGDPFGQLTEAFLQLDALLGNGASLITDIDESVEKTAESAGKLSTYLEQIQDISFQTRLIGLNSIIKAARLGEHGQTFEVLSNQLTGMTEYSDNFVGSVERIVDSVSGHIEKTKLQTIDGCGHDLSIGQVVERCARQYRRFNEMSVSAGFAAQTIKEDLARIRGELEFLGRLRQELSGLADRCGELARLLYPLACMEQKNSEQFRQELAERYTMQQERDIHENMLSLSSVAVTAAEDGTREDAELFFDNEPEDEMETKNAGMDAAVISPMAESESVLIDSNVELF